MAIQALFDDRFKTNRLKCDPIRGWPLPLAASSPRTTNALYTFANQKKFLCGFGSRIFLFDESCRRTFRIDSAI